MNSRHAGAGNGSTGPSLSVLSLTAMVPLPFPASTQARLSLAEDVRPQAPLPIP